eukprot:TRINITY_DN15837_c0_g1_i2.p1 TRINITY_DN15837_c0_g1~~TRINITY_DN15837_c0_g1_i2.p1  ORF type:complete len:623 (-),score=79.30 TRINITY_DN15837_c0_g1_i2:54-1922(-)
MNSWFFLFSLVETATVSAPNSAALDTRVALVLHEDGWLSHSRHTASHVARQKTQHARGVHHLRHSLDESQRGNLTKFGLSQVSTSEMTTRQLVSGTPTSSTPPRQRFSLSPSEALRGSVATKVAMSGIGFICTLAILGNAIWFGGHSAAESEDDTWPAECARRVFLFHWFLDGVLLTIVIPDSLNIAMIVGRNAQFSGALISVVKLGSGIAVIPLWLLFRANNDVWLTHIRATLLLSTVLEIAAAVVFAGAVAFHDHIPHADHVILGARFAIGLGAGGKSLTLRKILAQTCVPSERPDQFTRLKFYTMLSVGLGPFFASTARYVFWGAVGGKEEEKADLALQVLPTSIATLCVCALAISSIAALPPSRDICIVHDDEAEDSVDEGQEMNKQPRHQALRQRIIVWCILFSASRAFVIAGLEAATVMIFQGSFGWSLSRVGFVISLSFMACVPLHYVYLLVKEQLPVEAWIRFSNSTSFVGSLLLFPVFGAHLWIKPSTVLVIADNLLFPTFMLASGLVEGIMTAVALPPGFLFSLDNVLLMGCIWVDSIGRFAGPPVARANISIAGQEGYAFQQMVTTAMACAMAEFGVLRPVALFYNDKPVGSREAPSLLASSRPASITVVD